MITRITGKLARLETAAAFLDIGPFEHEVWIPEVVRRQLQSVDENTEVSLHTVEFIDGNVQRGGRLTPRIIGFLSPVEREFFDLFCSVDGLGVKKALAAMNRPVADIATAIEEKDARTLTQLPGIGAAVADRVIAKLSRKMAKFALLIQEAAEDRPPVERDVLHDTVDALMALGHAPDEARRLTDEAARSLGKKAKSVEAILSEVYRLQREGE